MAEPSSAETEKVKIGDPMAEVNAPVNSEPESPDSPISDLEDEIRRDEEHHEKRVEREQIKRTQSTATDASVLTRATTGPTRPVVVPKSKSWYNPLRWGKIPSIPEERGVSREYYAGFWSRLTFQWMAPLMNVRLKMNVVVGSLADIITGWLQTATRYERYLDYQS